jgi:hypothetical protein
VKNIDKIYLFYEKGKERLYFMLLLLLFLYYIIVSQDLEIQHFLQGEQSRSSRVQNRAYQHIGVSESDQNGCRYHACDYE